MLDELSKRGHLSDTGDWPETPEREMTELTEDAADRGKGRRIEVADETLTYRNVLIDDLTPTGAQLAAAAGFKPKQHAVVLQVLANGELEDVRPGETVDLKRNGGRFVIVATDRDYFITVDGQRFQWPCRIVSGAIVRKLGRLSADVAVYLEQADEPDREIGDQDLVDRRTFRHPRSGQGGRRSDQCISGSLGGDDYAGRFGAVRHRCPAQAAGSDQRLSAGSPARANATSGSHQQDRSPHHRLANRASAGLGVQRWRELRRLRRSSQF